ncbi:hypothetical protein [Helicobacter bilis]|uniref:Uncharacterized protein n=1 Tax=Helicobacter bilis TaxID=37372 RepID=A0A4U8U912_9HELI|nr:hypothetical protein [Helicobacter bilis]MCI7411436.1 hypothetical protein [Helicobacter bilis]MDD7297474.1 hypothetical protein [Helicobacter bilis]MDY4400291.1 hypothetical protein [Helicobacter bilis]TLE08929.1 hypothetical protein LS78_003770 [Helicobacter bilis]TLE10883.1 hypothetical protein LS79_004280 [Helicobacter bilis]
MKILDYLFYIALCIVASIGLFSFNRSVDMYFFLPTFESTRYEVYEKEQWQLDSINLVSMDITQINPDKYLISYISKDKDNNTNLYGMIFYPSKYSILTQKGAWQNIATNTKTHSQEILLFDTKTLNAQAKQHIHSLHSALIQNIDSNLYLFLNATLLQKPLTTRAYIFQANLEHIAKAIESNTTQENAKPLFSLHENPALSLFARTNAFFSHKPSTFFGTNTTIQGMILPFFTHIEKDQAFFGIFNKELQLEEIAKPHNNTLYSNPIITPLHPSYDINNPANDSITHRCLALYSNKSVQENTPNLAYQLCKISNGSLQFEDMQESSNLSVGAMSVAAFGRYIVLLYTNKENTTINLAVWNGSDFITLKELDRSTKGSFINPKILTHGPYAYIAYAKDMQSKINIITLNETYINNLIASRNAINQNAMK